MPELFHRNAKDFSGGFTEGTEVHGVEPRGVGRPRPPRRLGGRAYVGGSLATGMAFLLLQDLFLDEVATHFRLDGTADGYSSPAAALGLYMLMSVIEAVGTIAAGFSARSAPHHHKISEYLLRGFPREGVR
ncbi:hypothetical protein [Streptomyces coerulescens]|uniref:Uncharacterized protein n=1 Tax=Streptomyces coerulescens TaxID=29304 RepID=A0ABW0CX16_STRCD